MSLGKNLQFLRRMHNSMTQEALAEKLGVSRQTISKWESDLAYPEMDKVFELCDFFSCTMDRLLRENMNLEHEAYSPVQIRRIEAFSYVRYVVISPDPEGDAIKHMENWAREHGLACDGSDGSQLIGWDFPFLSMEQINVYHMHGYTAACILPEDFVPICKESEVIRQEAGDYAAITITDPFKSPFELIPNAYKTVLSYLEVNRPEQTGAGELLSCFEKTYEVDGVTYMDVLIAVKGK